MSGKTSEKMTRGLQLSCGRPKCLLALSGISLRCLRWPYSPEEGPGFQGPTPSTRSSSGSLFVAVLSWQSCSACYVLPDIFWMSSLISTNNRHFWNCLLALFIEFVCDRPRLLAGTVHCILYSPNTTVLTVTKIVLLMWGKYCISTVSNTAHACSFPNIFEHMKKKIEIILVRKIRVLDGTGSLKNKD